MSALAKKAVRMTLSDYYKQAGVQDETPFADDIIIDPEMIPMPHQVEDLNLFLSNGIWGNFSEPGTAKTLPSQAFALYLIGNGYPVLVIMPPALLVQFKRSLFSTFRGAEKLVNYHTLNDDPLPMRLTKRRVQDIKAHISMGNPLDPPVPKTVIDHVAKMHRAVNVPFTARQVEAIRNSDAKAEEIANLLGCSKHAVSSIRRKVFREDLYKRWNDSGWPDLLAMSYQMYIKVDREVFDHYNVLIADEAHALCHDSTTSRKVRRFVEKNNRGVAFVPMTGTPIPNVPTDAYGLIRLINPKAYSSFNEFKRIHCTTDLIPVKDRYDNIKQVEVIDQEGYKNLDTLHVNLFAKAVRRTKEQVFPGLKKPMIQEIEVNLTSDHMALYKRLVKERVLEVDGDTINAVEAQSLRQKCLRIVTYPDQFCDRAPANAVRERLEELLDEIGCAHQEKVVMFAIYNKSIEAMAEWFKDLNPALAYGGSNVPKNVEKFQTDDSCRLLIAHPQSGGVGLNLQEQSRYVIFAEPTSVPGWFTQASERVYRKGQKKVVTFYILRVMGTIWPKMVDSMRGKMRLSQTVTRDKTQMLEELLGN